MGIVVDPTETNARFARDLGLSFPLLSDPTAATIDAYGLRHAGGHAGSDIAHPASILIDSAGIVRWREVSKSVNKRPTPAIVLAALDRLTPTHPE